MYFIFIILSFDNQTKTNFVIFKRRFFKPQKMNTFFTPFISRTLNDLANRAEKQLNIIR